MLSRRHIPVSSILMVGSLCLLAVFEFLWLNSEYSLEREHLEEQQTLRLHTAIRELEDSLFHAAAWIPRDGMPGDTGECEVPHIRLTARAHFVSDSTPLITMIRSTEGAPADTVKFRHHRPHKGAMILGTLVNQMTGNTDSAQVLVVLDKMLTEKLNSDEYDPAVAHAKLMSWTNAPPDTSGIVSRPFYDLFSNTHFALQNPDYHLYLLKQLIPQLLFSLILFACITGAFMIISRNLRKQRNLALMRSNLISNISHELKTPISTVRVALESLQNFSMDKDEQRRNEYFSIARSEINRLGLLVDKVLRSSTMENGKAPLKIERFDLKDLLTEITDTLKVQFTRAEANVTTETSGSDFNIEADKLHITGLVHNLLDNALKYGGEHPAIHLGLAQQNGNILLQVTDHGNGIPREYQHRVFDQFFRVPSGDVHNVKGHGLGLSYVAQVVQEHGGKIDLESESGQGTTFTVTLPKHHGS